VEKKRGRAGWHVHIVVKRKIHRRLFRLTKTLLTNQSMGIITAAIPAISLEVIQEDIAGEKDFWAVYSRPEFQPPSSMVISLRNTSASGALVQWPERANTVGALR
jgi:hypothetical protein